MLRLPFANPQPLCISSFDALHQPVLQVARNFYVGLGSSRLRYDQEETFRSLAGDSKEF